MGAIWVTLLSAAGKALLSILMSLATKGFFEKMFLWLAEKGVKSTKTTWDDEFFKQIKDAKEKADRK